MLALIALPILVLFGADMVTEMEIDASTRLITALTFAIAVCVAPLLLWRRVRGRGVPPSDANGGRDRIRGARLRTDSASEREHGMGKSASGGDGGGRAGSPRLA